MAFDISNYVTVAERVAMFYEKYPEPTEHLMIYCRALVQHQNLLLARVHTQMDQSCKT